MSTLRQLPAILSALRSTGARRLTLAVGLILSSCTMLVAASPATAVVTPVVGGHQYGAEPQSPAAAAKPVTPLGYENGPVVHSSAPYAIYWDPNDAYAEWEGLVSGFLEGVGDASGSLENVFAVATQYRDAEGNAAYSSNFRGAYTDVAQVQTAEECGEPAPCLSDTQIRKELTSYISTNGLPGGLNPSTGPTPIYFVFTPPRTTVCLGAPHETGHCSGSAGEPLCSYHSFATVNGMTVLYAVEPWTPIEACQNGSGTLQKPNALDEPGTRPALGRADVIVNGVADEQIATATDPLLTGWHDTSGAKNEVPDKCRNEFGGGLLAGPPGEEFNQSFTVDKGSGLRNYYLNDEFDQAALFDPFPGHPCINEVKVEPEFTSPNPVRSGDSVTFNATESYVDLGIAKANWSFGDGATAEVNCEGRTPTNHVAPAGCNGSSGVGNPNSVASVVHRYTCIGTYPVTLTVTDDGGNTKEVTHPIAVTGTPCPSPEPASAGAGAGAAQTGSAASSSSGAGSPGATSHANPVASQAVVSHSLSSVLSSGLVVRYSVSEQVAGRFEVLLASSIARKLGVKGASATSLAKGTPPETIIAKAILVTTKGGKGTYNIKFSKATAAKLRKLHKVSLMIRLVVHNAASPAVTTVLNTVNLSR